MITARPSHFTKYHHNLLLWLAIYHRHLTVRNLSKLRYLSGELVFPEGELRSYCGRLLTSLKTEAHKALILKLDEDFDPVDDFLFLKELEHRSLPSSLSHPPSCPSPPQPQSAQKKQEAQLHSTARTPNMRSPNKSPHRHRSSKDRPSKSPLRPKPTTSMLPMPQLEDGVIANFHTWAHSCEGYQQETGILVCTAVVNDSDTNPKESMFATRILKRVNESTLLVNEFQSKISAGITVDNKGRPAIFISQPSASHGAILDNDMVDATALGTYATAKFGGDQSAINNEMNRHLLEEHYGTHLTVVDVVTLPELQQDEEDDDDDNKLSYSNAEFNNYPDASNQLTYPPPDNMLNPTVYIPEEGKKRKNLGVTFSVVHGYIMVQVYVKGSRKDLKLKNAAVDSAGDNENYLASLNRQIAQRLNISGG